MQIAAAQLIGIHGADADGSDLAAHLHRVAAEPVAAIRGILDIAVDVDAGFGAAAVIHIDPVNDAGHLVDAVDDARHLHQQANISVRHGVRTTDLLRCNRCGGTLNDINLSAVVLGEVQLNLTVIIGDAAMDADLLADLEIAGHGEDVDAAGLVLNVDAVEESCILVIAGGVGGHNTLQGELLLFSTLLGVGDGDHGIVIRTSDIDFFTGRHRLGFTVCRDLEHSLHLVAAIGRGRPVIGIRLASVGSNAVAGGHNRGLNAVHSDRIAVHSDSCVFLIGDRQGQSMRLVFYRFALVCDGGAYIEFGGVHLIHPDGSRYGGVLIALDHTDVVIGAGVRQLRVQLSGVGGDGIRGVQNRAVLTDNLNLPDGVISIGVRQGDRNLHLAVGEVIDDAAHRHVVQRVDDGQVLVLGGVHPALGHGFVEAFLGEIVSQDHRAAGIGVAPLPLVVILVVGGGHMPATAERHIIVLIAREVAVGADRALAVAYFQQGHHFVPLGGPAGEAVEGAEGSAGMVELGVRNTLGLVLRLHQQVVIIQHAGVVGLVVQFGIVSGDDAGRVESIDVAGAAGPGHLKAAQGDLVSGMRGVKGSDGALVVRPRFCAVIRHLAGIVEGFGRIGCRRLIKVVGVVGKGHEIHLFIAAQAADIIQSLLQRTGTVGISGVRVKLAKVQIGLCLADVKCPGLFGGFSIRSHDADGDRVLTILHLIVLIGNLPAFHLGRDRLAVDLHGNSGSLSGVDISNRDLRRRAGGNAAHRRRRDRDDDRQVLDPVGLAALIGCAGFRRPLLAGGLDGNGQRRVAGQICRGNRHGAVFAAEYSRAGLFRCAVFKSDQRRGAQIRTQIIQCELHREVQAQIRGSLRCECDLGIDNIACTVSIRHGIEPEGEVLVGAALVGPAGEGAGEILHADPAALIGGLLVVHNVAALGFLQCPLAVVGEVVLQEQRFSIAVTVVFVRGQILTVVRKGVIGGAVLLIGLNREDQAAIPGIHRLAAVLAVHQCRSDHAHVSGGIVAALGADDSLGIVIVDHILAVCGQGAGLGAGANVAVGVRNA